jgi:hypothetical protein
LGVAVPFVALVGRRLVEVLPTAYTNFRTTPSPKLLAAFWFVTTFVLLGIGFHLGEMLFVVLLSGYLARDEMISTTSQPFKKGRYVAFWIGFVGVVYGLRARVRL